MLITDAIENARTAAGTPNFKLIHCYEGGSALHGARLEGKADLDIYGVFIEPPTRMFGLTPLQHFITSTSDQEARNTADDVDICLYSLRNWATLATKGNPTALNFLFAPNQFYLRTNLWNQNIIALRGAILSRQAASHFRGFVDGQMKRLLGQGTGKHGQRKEMVEKFGYDCKAAMHAVRLMGEGIELMSTGFMTFPRPNKENLIAIRNGAYSVDHISAMVSSLMNELDDAEAHSPLPATPYRGAVSSILTEMYMTAYADSVPYGHI
jgi:predicted nucleotidyltransferase